MVCSVSQWRNQDSRLVKSSVELPLSGWIPVAGSTRNIPNTPQSATPSNIAEIDGCSVEMEDCLKSPLSEWISVAANSTDHLCNPVFVTAKISSGVEIDGRSSQMEPSIPGWILVTGDSTDLLCTPSANISSGAEIDGLSSHAPHSEWISLAGSSRDLPCTPASATVANLSSEAEIDGLLFPIKDRLKPPLSEWIPLARNSSDLRCTPASVNVANISSGDEIDRLSFHAKDRLKSPLSEWIPKNTMDLWRTPTGPNISSGAEIDEKKMKRRISNRESARRSRIKRETRMKDLINEKSILEKKLYENKNRFVAICERRRLVESENELLRDETVKLRQHLNYLDQVTGSYKESDDNVNSDRTVLNPRQVYGPVKPHVTASSMLV